MDCQLPCSCQPVLSNLFQFSTSLCRYQRSHRLLCDAGPNRVSGAFGFVRLGDVVAGPVVRNAADRTCWATCRFCPVRQVGFAAWQWRCSGRKRVACRWRRKRIRNRRGGGTALLSVLDHAFIWAVGRSIVSRSPNRLGDPIAFLERNRIRLTQSRGLTLDHGC